MYSFPWETTEYYENINYRIFFQSSSQYLVLLPWEKGKETFDKDRTEYIFLYKDRNLILVKTYDFGKVKHTTDSILSGREVRQDFLIYNGIYSHVFVHSINIYEMNTDTTVGQFLQTFTYDEGTIHGAEIFDNIFLFFFKNSDSCGFYQYEVSNPQEPIYLSQIYLEDDFVFVIDQYNIAMHASHENYLILLTKYQRKIFIEVYIVGEPIHSALYFKKHIQVSEEILFIQPLIHMDSLYILLTCSQNIVYFRLNTRHSMFIGVSNPKFNMDMNLLTQIQIYPEDFEDELNTFTDNSSNLLIPYETTTTPSHYVSPYDCGSDSEYNSDSNSAVLGFKVEEKESNLFIHSKKESNTVSHLSFSLTNYINGFNPSFYKLKNESYFNITQNCLYKLQVNNRSKHLIYQFIFSGDKIYALEDESNRLYLFQNE